MITTNKTAGEDNSPVNNPALLPDQRRQRNEQFTARILERWSEEGPGSGSALFMALLHTAANGPIATPERAKAILPTLLDVIDEMRETVGN